MLNLTISTRKDAREMRERLEKAFGPGGLGLRGDTHEEMTVYTGGGGFVMATVHEEDGQTLINLSTQEFEEAVRQFAQELHEPALFGRSQR